jgi:L-alanine-DL-glutamate epimerase-like enolase superfamily enzyme
LPGRSRDDGAAMAWAEWCAVTDATARARGVSFASLIGNPAPRRDVAVVVSDLAGAVAAVAGGARCLKVKLTGPDVRAAVALVGAIRGAVAVPIRVDGNRSFPDAAALCDGLAPLGLDFVEEPGPAPLPGTALDESLADGDPAVRFRALVLKPTILGPDRTLALARAHPAVISHALEGPVGMAALAELALVFGGELAAGVAPHPGLGVWDLAIPTLRAHEVVDVPRRGTGLDVDAVLRAVARFP